VLVRTAAGFACVLLGILHFVDRDRPSQARTYYFGNVVPSSPVIRGVLAIAEVGIGFALLFSA
jgi:hypothetical protein